MSNLPSLSIPDGQLDLFEAFGLQSVPLFLEPEPPPAELTYTPVNVEQVYGVLAVVARTKFTAFGSLESDDFLQEMCLKVITTPIQHPGAAITFAKRRVLDLIRTENRRSHPALLEEDFLGHDSGDLMTQVDELIDSGIPALSLFA